MSYKRKLLTIGSTVMLTAGLVTLTPVEAQEVEVQHEVTDTILAKQGWLGDYFYKIDGTMAKNEWIKDDTGNWYYMRADGVYAHNEWAGAYYMKANGLTATNEWIKDSAENWYYMREDGIYAHNEWAGAYYMDSKGSMIKDEWIKDKENWYYMREDGIYAHNEWIGSYYMKEKGLMAYNEWIKDKANKWYFIDDSNKYIRHQWFGKYYLKEWGAMAINEWVYDDHTREWYFFTKDTGEMAIGWVNDGKKIYYMNPNGTIHRGLVYDDDSKAWYYLDAAGVKQIGHVQLSDIGLAVTTDDNGRILNEDGYLNQINRAIDWFVEREGKVTYSMINRNGPDSYDCSSSLYRALWAGKFATKITWPGNTETLYKEKGYLFIEIDARDVRRGDVFISGYEGNSLGSGGHTGMAMDNDSIYHCNYPLNGINLTPIKGYTVEHKYPVRWFRIINKK